ncbi:hypothetical protein EFER_4315 [Escherichia fergusonii ATCC 35469]|uniref:Uncharacterized protein n=1 Tax=Escherichia fergusonii (strain ATCC 35469 / DSM 13698 / CCUG 18766 / IAM 14443 / JCM 21226 / LMG 7866 / NBRC 102419 / NCTC 12128 / CDC 0568-73) TaxID=585054 RepID=B7LMQ6_ESCF3|nr:hypothetical protein EFER_4315 [Escherichia fergusonii ATCC 35469]
MHYIHFWKTPRKNEDDTQEYAVVKIDIAVILRRGRKRWAVTFHRPIRN